MLIRFDPLRELDRIVDQLGDGRRRHSMPMDAYRIGDTLHVDLDIPGVDADAVEVTAEKNAVTVRAERRWDSEGVDIVACERPQGTFVRELLFGETADVEHLTASYENGVVRLRIPMAEQAGARRIEVRSTSETEPVTAKTT